MRSIKNCMKAVVAPAVILIVLIVIAAGIGYYWYTGSQTPYWETKNEFGSWQDEIYIEFEDGSETTLKIVQNQMLPFTTVYYGSSPIQNVGYKVTASVSGSGYTSALIDLDNFGYNSYIRKTSSSTRLYEGSASSSQNYDVSVGASQQIFKQGFNIKATVDNPSVFPTGTYRVHFEPKGTCKYKGSPAQSGDSWQSVSLPPARTLDVVIDNGFQGSILVTISSEGYTS